MTHFDSVAAASAHFSGTGTTVGFPSSPAFQDLTVGDLFSALPGSQVRDSYVTEFQEDGTLVLHPVGDNVLVTVTEGTH